MTFTRFQLTAIVLSNCYYLLLVFTEFIFHITKINTTLYEASKLSLINYVTVSIFRISVNFVAFFLMIDIILFFLFLCLDNPKNMYKWIWRKNNISCSIIIIGRKQNTTKGNMKLITNIRLFFLPMTAHLQHNLSKSLHNLIINYTISNKHNYCTRCLL